LATVVLDASALLSVVFEERGYERVLPLLESACVSTVNLAEVFTRIVRDRRPIEDVVARFDRFSVEWVAFSEGHAAQAAELWPLTRGAGLSLGDRACLALAVERSLPVLTADRAWTGLGLPVEVVLIR
jgi:ribonuclease VapC